MFMNTSKDDIIWAKLSGSIGNPVVCSGKSNINTNGKEPLTPKNKICTKMLGQKFYIKGGGSNF